MAESTKTVTVRSGRFGFPFLTAGVILVLAGSQWFPNARTVGWILLAIGLLPLGILLAALIGMLIVLIVAEVLDSRSAKRRRRAVADRRRPR